jgi:hypothetical protein
VELLRDDVDDGFTQALGKLHGTIHEGKKSEVTTHANAFTRLVDGTMLANEDLTNRGFFAAKFLDAEAFSPSLVMLAYRATGFNV